HLVPPSRPRVTGSTRITFDSHSKGRMATDGSRIYFSSSSGFDCVLYNTPGRVCDAVPPQTSIPAHTINDISSDGSGLLVGDCPIWQQGLDCHLWVLPVLGQPRSPRRLVEGANGAWSRDGQQLV